MFKKGIAAAGCLAIVAAGWSYAATTWQVQTKLSNTGGTIQVRNKALQTAVGSVVYSNFTTSADIPVTVTAKSGYKIGTIYKGGVAQTLGNDQVYSVSLNKTNGLTQSITASFIASQFTITGTAVGSGTVTANPSAVYAGGSTTLTIAPKSSFDVLTNVSPSGLTLKDSTGKVVATPYSGTVFVTLTNVQGPQAVTATFATAGVSAGPDTVVEVSKPVTIQGSVATGNTISWTQVSGTPVTLTGATTATPSFTPAAAGTYVFQATESLKGLTDTVQVDVTGDMVAYMESSCGGCHNATGGVVPSNANNGWKLSAHKTASVTCVTCHTNGAMPTPVNQNTVNKDTFVITGASAGQLDNNYCDSCHNGVRTATHSATEVSTTTCSKCHTPHYFSELGQNHFAGLASPATADGSSRTQYFSQGVTCADCHNVNSNQVNAGYAVGGHGAISDKADNAFVHYDWSGRTNNGTRQNGNCDRCHTTGGFLKLLGSADATRLAPKAGVQNVLACVSCHSDLATGALRTGATPAGNPTALSGGYFALFSSAASAVPAGKTKIQVQFPGYKNSSICIPCHSGRSTDDVFVAVIDQIKAVNGNYSTSIQTSYYQHAANMGQTFIGKGAYNFDGVDYVGTNGHAGVKNNFTDTEGPCVGCHYSNTAATHSLQPVGYTEVCGACHRAGFGAADVEEKKAEFDAGVAVLDALIRAKFNPLRVNQTVSLETERAYVAFGKFGADATGTGYPLAADVRAKHAYGAWYNWQILATYDKAAFAHNPTFARQILMETIDYLDDAKINGTAEATIAASALAAADKEKAEKYVTSVGCAICHASKDTLVASGKHANEVSTHSGTCGRCHTSEGYAAFLANGNSPAGNYTKTALAGNPSFNGLDNSYNGSQNVSCVACHDQHGTVRNVAWTPQPKDTAAAPSVEYKLCTSCHNLTDASGNVMASGLLVNGTQTVAMQQHYKDWYRNIASTHYDLPSTGTVTNVGTIIEGYNIRYNSATACTDCHGHEFYTNSAKALEAPSATDADKGKGTVQTEWAASGHAGKILKVKFDTFTTANPTRSRTNTNNAAVQGVGVTSATGMAWEHYNWDDSTGTASDRKTCQKCHTATGSANYLTNPAAYNAANNDFSHLAQWTTAKVSPQNEVLYCWGCHTSAETGALRNPGAVTTADYTFKGANASFPDVGASNVCITCHGGQKSGESITALTTAGNTFTNVSFVNSHYMAAASIMYAKAGYTNFIDPNTVIGTSTYGKSLTTTEDGGLLSSTHRKLGTAAIIGDHGITAEMGLAEGGPCATCHYAGGNHELEIGAVAFTKVCVNCHDAEGTTTLTTENFKEVFIEEQAVPFKDAISLALAKLSANYGITYNASAYPYFYDARNANSAVKDWTRGGQLTAAEAEKLMGACFNINLLNRDPAAYVHARTYARRLLYDTIDFLDDKAINMSTGATAIAWDPVKYVKDATAGGTTTEDFKYLAGYNRTSLAWNALQRP